MNCRSQARVEVFDGRIAPGTAVAPGNDAPTTLRTALNGHTTPQAHETPAGVPWVHRRSAWWLGQQGAGTRPCGHRKTEAQPRNGCQANGANSPLPNATGPSAHRSTRRAHKTRIALNPLQLHTHLQHSCRCLHVDNESSSERSRPVRWCMGDAASASLVPGIVAESSHEPAAVVDWWTDYR